MNFVTPLGYHCSMQPNWCQGATLFGMNEFRLIKLILSTVVLIFWVVVVLWGGNVLLLSFPVLASAVLWAFKCMCETSNATLPSHSGRLFILVTAFSLLVTKESVPDVTILPLAKDNPSLPAGDCGALKDNCGRAGPSL